MVNCSLFPAPNVIDLFRDNRKFWFLIPERNRELVARTNLLGMMMMIIIITRIIIGFKSAIRDFFTISSQRRELSPTRTLKWPGRNHVQITCNTSSAYHVQVSCYVPLGTKGQLRY